MIIYHHCKRCNKFLRLTDIDNKMPDGCVSDHEWVDNISTLCPDCTRDYFENVGKNMLQGICNPLAQSDKDIKNETIILHGQM